MKDDANTEDSDSADPDFEDSESEMREPRPLRLDQFLKLCGVTETGGRAKALIQGGDIMVNGEVETRRRRKLASGDVIEVFGAVLPVDEYFTSD